MGKEIGTLFLMCNSFIESEDGDVLRLLIFLLDFQKGVSLRLKNVCSLSVSSRNEHNKIWH